MTIALEKFRTISSTDSVRAWSEIFSHALSVCSRPLTAQTASSEVTNRDRSLSSFDLFLAAAGWHLWHEYYNSVETTANALSAWWNQQTQGRAVLILDGLSLRELPWILQGAKERGFQISTKVTGSELPGDTRSFAKALGLGQRSSLENNKPPSTSRLPEAATESSGSPWTDCTTIIGSQPRWVFWHHWPDSRIHELGGQSGKGLPDLTKEVSERLSEEAFWTFIERLTTGRKLVITSDHGYAAAGLFSDVPDAEQSNYLKSLFASGRFATTDAVPDAFWIPPLDLPFEGAHGKARLVLGRRRWKSPGGYPTLTHGGLSVLECAVPFIELSR